MSFCSGVISTYNLVIKTIILISNKLAPNTIETENEKNALPAELPHFHILL